jgi:two-component system sensor histidine kinase RegB
LHLFSHLAIDLVGLSGLLFFTGGATNPFVFLLLPSVAIAAMTLPVRWVAGVGALAIAAYSMLMVSFIPLPLADPQRAASLHLSGMWFTFVVATLMISWLIVRMTRALRERDAELASVREKALRDERVLAMGALAAGAAHELGTPLATLAVLASEIEADARLGAEAHADLQLMREQIAYCKRIITRLTVQAGAERVEQVEPLRCDTWLEGLYEDWHALRDFPNSEFRKVGAASSGRFRPDGLPTDGMKCTVAGMAPLIVVDPALDQAVINLLDNALRAGAPVALALDWNEQRLRIVISDQGPGFSPQVLNQAGRIPFPASATGSGIGLILTRAAIERVGGELLLGNAHTGGGFVQVVLPLDRIGRHG